jgi:dethiobiotin synthetase
MLIKQIHRVFALKSYFVTATDTEIGKTVITAGLASAIRSKGIDVGVMKPFACGTPQEHGFRSEDAQILARAAGVNDPEDLINPCFFSIPVSPYLAARKIGATIDVGQVLTKFEKLRSLHQVLLVEGIGGILTPILRDYCVADLIKDMNLEVLIVTSSKIGTVNHTLLTCDACKKYGIGIRGIVINNYDSAGYDVADLANDLTNLSGVEVLCAIPHLGDQSKLPEMLADTLIPKLTF